MTEQDLHALGADIRTWHERLRAVESAMDALDSVLMISPEAPLYQAIWRMADSCDDIIAGRWRIDREWLAWWRFECNLGDTPREAGIVDQPLRRIATIDDLIQLILDELARAESST